MASRSPKIREPRWRRDGDRPDYRFSLANERTFLAWVRTSMAILAGAIAIDQLTPNIAPTPVRIVLCAILAVCGAVLSVEAYRRWALQEKAMRHNRELPHSQLLLIMAGAVALSGAIVVALILFVR